MNDASAPEDARPTVRLGFQQLKGLVSEVTGLEEFRGIPYAIARRRWSHSQLRTSLPSDNFDAGSHGPKCPQPSEPNNTLSFQAHLDFPNITESELECLNLFIVRPRMHGSSTDNQALPVFVWIHGGAYAFGSSTDPPWDPRHLVQASVERQSPVIVVGVNYRLNAFGYLGAEELALSPDNDDLQGCNYGSRDQYNALEWIHKNIGAFGGDPHSITIAGQSAGGSSVHVQVLQQKQHAFPRLFRNAIIHSGAIDTLGPIPLSEAQQAFERLCEDLDIAPGMNRVELLRNTAACDIVNAGKRLGWWVFPLVNDGHTIRAARNGHWAVNLSQGHVSAVSPRDEPPIGVMIGDVEDEGSIFRDSLSNITSYAQAKQAFSSSNNVDRVLSAYGIRPNSSSAQLQDGLRGFLTDLEFRMPVQQARDGLSSDHKADNDEEEVTSFSHSYRMAMGNPWPGVGQGLAHHCIDLVYLFNAFAKAMKQAEEEWSAAPGSYMSHLTTVASVQAHWLDFITSKQPIERSQSSAIVWDEHRIRRVESMVWSKYWLERKRRFQILEEDLVGMKLVRDALLNMEENRNS